MNPHFHTDFSISDSLIFVRKSVLIYETIINIITRRWYDSNGNAYRDVDMTNHGNSKTHPEYPHEHTWNWSDGIPKRSK